MSNWNDTRTCSAAAPMRQGLFVDQKDREIAGAVRRDGDSFQPR